MDIRELKARDVKTLAKMLGKLKETSVSDIMVALERKGDPMAIGLSLFRVVAADLTDDIYAWLADLIGKTPVELDEMPASTPVDIVKALVKRGDFGDFLGSVTRRGRKPKASTASMISFNPGTDGQTIP